MAVIGNSSTQQAFTPAIDYFSGNGSTTAFTLSRPVASVAQVQVVIDNVAQNPSSAYTVSSNTITFTSAPLSGTNNIYVYYTSPITQVIAPGQSTVGLTQFTATGTPSASTYLRGDNSWATVASPSAATPTALGTVYGSTPSATTSAFLGYQAGNSNTGIRNVGMGNGSLFTNSSGSYQTAIGYQALYSNTTSNENSALGYQASYSNTTGNENVAVGSNALYTNSTTNAHVAIGRRALYANTTGDSNTAVGHSAGKAVTTGSYNAIFGAYAGQSLTTGGRNSIIGEGAGSSVTTGNYVTLVGDNAGNAITTGSGITCVGREAGANLVDGSYGTYIGYGSTASSSSVGYEMVICTTAGTVSGKGSSTGFISVGGGSIYQGNNSSSWATTSDRRLKKNIVNNTEGLDKITQIQVRNFEYRLPEEVTELDSSTAVDISGVQLGVIAQELQQVCPDCVKEESTGVLRVDSDNVFWHMLNAIKDLKALNDTQAATITALTARITALENK
jgi:hypothetical protein